ncbi:MAG: GNAT family N-acetyltransferase [Proteobacteria bacterium]|nr:GNAT family N-acetyltransferase [Pseudomonadota bacterium]
MRIRNVALPVDSRIISLNASHLQAIESLLKSYNLPFEDCAEHLENFIGIIRGDKLIAIGALQIEGSTALLRSIVVYSEMRGAGLAVEITRYLLNIARNQGVRELYLLTETAESYFTRFGFCAVDRGTVPVEIQSTRQFGSLCPSSAQTMRLDL